jgi:hypothetical protein
MIFEYLTVGKKTFHQDLWLPDERLRFRPDGGRLGAAWL